MKSATQHRSENVLEGVTVLLTEDDPMNQFIAKKFLTKWGLQVKVANNGKEAVDMIQTKEFQIVLMDIHMPVMDGYEAVRQIRAMQDNYFKTVPIIAFSAVIENKDEAIEMGMTDFSTKPINPTDLQQKIIQHHIKLSNKEPGERRLFVDFDVYTDGDEEFKHELINLMIQNMHELNYAVEQTCYGHTSDILEKTVHKVKPTLCMLNDSELLDVISLLRETSPMKHVYAQVAQRYHEMMNLVISALIDEAEQASKVLVPVSAKAA
jgi:CheY-like chemotaxis protein